MSRDWEGDDLDDNWALTMGRWERNMRVVLKSKRGQKFLIEMEEALLVLPEHKLVKGIVCDLRLEPVNEEGDLEYKSAVCAIGAFALYKGVEPEKLSTEYESAWDTIEIATQLGMSMTMAWMIGEQNDDWRSETDEERWQRIFNWVQYHKAAI